MIKCVSMNARSICNKLPELYQLLYLETYDVILITESWLNGNIVNSLIDPHNPYVSVRHVRSDHSVGGGTCALIRKPLNVVEMILDQSYSNLELCSFDVHCYEVCTQFIAEYRSPSFKCVNNLTNCMSNLIDTANPRIIAGDLNCADIDWSNLTVPGDGVQDALLNFTLFNGMSQIISEQ
jgi:exonuclease III